MRDLIALIPGNGPPLDCSHCGRWIPGDMIATYDTSGCPLAVPCTKPVGGAAWPMPGDDDDDTEDYPQPRKDAPCTA